MAKPLPDQIKIDAAQTRLDQQEKNAGWQRFRCTLVTPMYGGGVEAGKVDEQMPIRATAIRGQLRFWWRIAHRPQFIKDGKLDHRAMFQRERELWGGLGKGDELAASKVVIRLLGALQQARYEPAAKYNRKQDGTYRSMPDWEPWADGYALFPAQGKASKTGIEIPPPKLLKAGAAWDMAINLGRLDETDRKEVETALRWWASFGGVGARTRRGLGAVDVEEIRADGSMHLASVTQQEAKNIGLTLVFRGERMDQPISAWKKAVDALRLYRQGEGIGRNRGQEPNRPGRSRWPEPDAIRRHANTHSPLHAPTHLAEKRFPRAAFGLPIIFHFKDRGDPADATLTPAGKERMASPLILRPYRQADGGWRSAALRLPYAHVLACGLSLSLRGRTDTLNLNSGEWWPLARDAEQRRAVADVVKPIKLAGSPTEPLTAFLTFFQKPELADQANEGR